MAFLCLEEFLPVSLVCCVCCSLNNLVDLGVWSPILWLRALCHCWRLLGDSICFPFTGPLRGDGPGFLALSANHYYGSALVGLEGDPGFPGLPCGRLNRTTRSRAFHVSPASVTANTRLAEWAWGGCRVVVVGRWKAGGVGDRLLSIASSPLPCRSSFGTVKGLSPGSGAPLIPAGGDAVGGLGGALASRGDACPVRGCLAV